MDSFTSWNNELYHHGVKGQKWGIRRYQNEDGSLTSAGKERYGRYESDEHVSPKKIKRDFNKLERVYGKTYARAQTYKGDYMGRILTSKEPTYEEFAKTRSGKIAKKSFEEASRSVKDMKHIEALQTKILNKAMKENYTINSIPVTRYRALGKNRVERFLSPDSIPVRENRIKKVSNEGDGSINLYNYSSGKIENYRKFNRN